MTPPGRRQAIQKLESLSRAGVTRLAARRRAKPAPAAEVPASPPAESEPGLAGRGGSGRAAVSAGVALSATEDNKGLTPSARPIGGAGLFPGEEAPCRPAAERLRVLTDLRGQVAACTRCPELVANRTQTVFGVGRLEPRLCFLGEAPGADEDRQGEPFVGRAGQLLNKIIEACRLTRDEVYILNILKCRPPDNRAPLPDEATNCRSFLDAQLRVLQPEFLCCLGATAAQNLLNTTVSIGKLRGAIHDYRGIRVVCTYHPAYLLRNPAMKRECWEDMKFLLREMGTPVE